LCDAQSKLAHQCFFRTFSIPVSGTQQFLRRKNKRRSKAAIKDLVGSCHPRDTFWDRSGVEVDAIGRSDRYRENNFLGVFNKRQSSTFAYHSCRISWRESSDGYAETGNETKKRNNFESDWNATKITSEIIALSFVTVTSALCQISSFTEKL
jgi:hypothetical protein